MSDAIVEDYLARLRAAAAGLPPDRTAELVEGIAEHIAEAREQGQVTDEASLRTLLDRLGAPDEIVAAARDDEHDGPPGPGPWQVRPPSEPRYRRPSLGLEYAALGLMTLGSLVPVVLWLVGVVLLWSSRRWRTAEKLVATLVFPGGPFVVLYLVGLFPTQVCSSSSSSDAAGAVVQGPEVCTGFALPPAVGIPSFLLWIVLPFVVAGVLLRRASERAAAEPPVLVLGAQRSPGASRWGALEVAAVVLLSLGSFVAPVVGPVAGLICAWASDAWTTTEKWVATAIASFVVLLPLLALVIVAV